MKNLIAVITLAAATTAQAQIRHVGDVAESKPSAAIELFLKGQK